MSWLSFLFPKKIATLYSPINGRIKIMEFYGRKYIEVGNLSQSGKTVEKIWRKLFRRLRTNDNGQKMDRLNVLLLGVAGGTVVKILNEEFPGCKITGIDIDPMIIKAGNKHFGLGSFKNLNIIITDAKKYIFKCKDKYDLIIVDLYLGRQIPEFIGDTGLLLKLEKILTSNGYVIFNRLYFQNYKNEAEIFLDKVKKIFHHVNGFKIDFNLLITAR